MHIQAFLCDRKLAPTTNKNLYRTLAEGLRVFSSLVVFPFSFCLVMLIHLDRCWKNNKRILTDNLLKTVIDNVSYNYILTLMQTWNMNVLFCNWTPWALANHIKTKTIRVHGGQQSKKKKKKTHLPVLVCIPLARLLFVHTSAIEVPVEGSISVLPQWFNSQAVWI